MATSHRTVVAFLGIALSVSMPGYALAQKAIDWDDADAVRVAPPGATLPPFEIVAVAPKPFLKRNRLELQVSGGLSINDSLIRHWQLAGQLTYFLSEKLAVGVEGAAYQAEPLAAMSLVPRQARRLPTVNRYVGSAALNFHYALMYGKFAHLRSKIIYWEALVTSGMGAIRTETIPRDPALTPFANYRMTVNAGFDVRVFANRFTTFTIGIRDYIFVDKLEPINRSTTRFASADSARQNATSTLINNVVVQLGVAVWFPTSFKRKRNRRASSL